LAVVSARSREDRVDGRLDCPHAVAVLEQTNRGGDRVRLEAAALSQRRGAHQRRGAAPHRNAARAERRHADRRQRPSVGPVRKADSRVGLSADERCLHHGIGLTRERGETLVEEVRHGYMAGREHADEGLGHGVERAVEPGGVVETTVDELVAPEVPASRTRSRRRADDRRARSFRGRREAHAGRPALRAARRATVRRRRR